MGSIYRWDRGGFVKRLSGTAQNFYRNFVYGEYSQRRNCYYRWNRWIFISEKQWKDFWLLEKKISNVRFYSYNAFSGLDCKYRKCKFDFITSWKLRSAGCRRFCKYFASIWYFQCCIWRKAKENTETADRWSVKSFIE